MDRSPHFSDRLWDLWCIASIVGIWPRFIEPNLIRVTQVPLAVKGLPEAAKGLRILQFSDLHLHPRISNAFLERLSQKIHQQAPDLIVFTGDFLCKATLIEKERLKRFLGGFKAPLGCFAILGNHDYAEYVSINQKGDYDVVEEEPSMILSGFTRMFAQPPLTKKVTERAQSVLRHQELISLIENSPFKLLDNATISLMEKGIPLNLCGVGEHTLGQCRPKEAFQAWNDQYPGVVLAHNPDSIPHLLDYPGDLILCGHTHGAQVNLPWMWHRLMKLENPHYKRGLIDLGSKKAYVNRGVGSIIPFRWFSPPEITLFTLT